MHTQEGIHQRREAGRPAGQVRQEPPGQRRHSLRGQGPQALLEGMGRVRGPAGQGPHGHGRPEGRQGGRLGHQRPGLGHPHVRHRQDRGDPAHHQHQLPGGGAGLRPQAVGHELPVPHRRGQDHRLRADRLQPGAGAADAAQGLVPQREVPVPQEGTSTTSP